ncbi:MAG: helix-turn-helix transcriptional regulator [Burkholderiales bacterium]|nr:helix-turn-helix transcriptional regulator [Burkholderiales bacterium]
MSVDTLIAERLLALRQSQGLSLAALAERSGVSKAMISRIERAQASATAALLGRLAAGLGVPLVHLLADAPAAPQRLRRRAEQPVWRDPALGYRRRQVSEPDATTGLQLVELQLPRAAEVHYPPWQGRPYRQRLWLLAGALRIDYGEEHFELAEGDCLDFGVDRPLCFRALGRTGCRYLLVISND